MSVINFEDFTAVIAEILVFKDVTSYRLVGGYQRFRGTYCLHFQNKIDSVEDEVN
jgi:hypothetical protein